MKLWLIRDAQLQALGIARAAAAERATIAWVKGEFAAEAAERGDEWLAEAVRHAKARAQEFGITGSELIQQWLELMMLLGPDFDEAARSAWVRPILTDQELGPRTRLALAIDEARKRMRRPRRKAGKS